MGFLTGSTAPLGFEGSDRLDDPTDQIDLAYMFGSHSVGES